MDWCCKGYCFRYTISYTECSNTILAALVEDKALAKIRLALVPRKISEYNFWRIYFYRVSMIKSLYGLDYYPIKKETTEYNAPAEKENKQTDVQSDSHVKTGEEIKVEQKQIDAENSKESPLTENEFASEYFNVEEEDQGLQWQADFKQELDKLGVKDEIGDDEGMLMILS